MGLADDVRSIEPSIWGGGEGDAAHGFGGSVCGSAWLSFENMVLAVDGGEGAEGRLL